MRKAAALASIPLQFPFVSDVRYKPWCGSCKDIAAGTDHCYYIPAASTITLYMFAEEAAEGLLPLCINNSYDAFATIAFIHVTHVNPSRVSK